MTTVHIQATIPDDTLRELLQLIRTFEGRRPDRHLAVAVQHSTFSKDELVAILKSLDPPMDHLMVLPLPREVH